MTQVWCLAILFLLFGCSSTAVNQSRFLAVPSPPRQEAPTEQARAEKKQNSAPVRPNDAEIQSAIDASDEGRELLDRRRYILDVGSDKDNAH
jgi:hypothetical protein